MSTGTYNPRALDGFVRKNRFYLKDGSNIFRILPPFKSLVENGVIAKYWAVFWLPTTKRGKDGKTVNKPVTSILQKDRDKKVIQPDPLFDKIETLKKSLEAMKKDGSQPEPVLKALEERINGLGLDKAYYLNVLTPAGEVGVLKIRYTAFQALKERLKECEKDGIDPINIGPGIFFDFKKGTDDKNKVVYSVDRHTRTYKDTSTGKFRTDIVEAPIDESILARMEKEAFDLSTLYKNLSPDEQAMAATLDPAVIERLFARPEPAEGSEEPAEGEDEDLKTNVVTAAIAQKAAAKAPAVTTTPLAVTAVTEPALMKQPEQVAQTAPQTVVQPQVQAPAQVAVAAGTDDFNDRVKKFLSTGVV